MTGSEWTAVLAVGINALAVMPGTLGVLLLTHKMAAHPAGARYIYRQSLWVLAASLLLLIWALYQAWTHDGISSLMIGLLAAYFGILVFAFFMHAGLNFQPVTKPRFIAVEEALRKFGAEEEVIGVLDGQHRPYAFVTRLARRPHVIYQPDGDSPFFVTHCILAHSSMAYPMTGNFSDPDIQVTAVLANNMVFYEKASRCSVTQIQNRPHSGGEEMPTSSTLMMSLKTWKHLYPNSQVWVREREWRDTFYLNLLARTSVIDPDSPDKVYPLEHPLDTRLPMKSLVLGVKIGDRTRAYPISAFADRAIIEERVGGENLLLWAAFGGDFIQIFKGETDGSAGFKRAENEDYFTDELTGSRWSPSGECLAGPSKGRRLEAIPHFNKIFWYVWADYYPQTTIYPA